MPSRRPKIPPKSRLSWITIRPKPSNAVRVLHWPDCAFRGRGPSEPDNSRALEFTNRIGVHFLRATIPMTQYWPFSGLTRYGALRERLIVSLDLGGRREALKLVDQLGRLVGMFKIGKQLFVSGGPDFVREVRRRGAEVFLDLKFHDSPRSLT